MASKRFQCILVVAVLAILALVPQAAFADTLNHQPLAVHNGSDNIGASASQLCYCDMTVQADMSADNGADSFVTTIQAETVTPENVDSDKPVPSASSALPGECSIANGAPQSAEQTPSEPGLSAQSNAVAQFEVQSGDPIVEGAYVIKARASYGSALSVSYSRDVGRVSVADIDGDYDQIFYFQPDGTGFYAIFSVFSGLALDASGDDLLQASYTGSGHQLFEARRAGGCFSLVSKAGRAVIASGNSAKTGVYSAGAVAQRLAFVEAPLVIPGVQVLFSAASPYSALGVADSSRSAGSACRASAYVAEDGQKMVVSRNGAGYAVRPLSSGMSLAPNGAAVAQQANAHIWEAGFSGAGARRGLVWNDSVTRKTIEVSGTSVLLSDSSSVSQAFLPARVSTVLDGCYVIKNLLAGTVLEIQAGNWANGANVQLYASNGTGAQCFDIKRLSTGLCRIVNAMTGYFVSAAGSNVYQYSDVGAFDQLWVPVASASGGIAWINAATGRALNATGGSSGANASTEMPTHTSAQSWTMVKRSYVSDPVLQTAMRYVTSSSSATNYQIMVDRSNCRTVIAQKSGGVWRPIFNWVCTPGAPSTPTVGGGYTVGIRGYSFDGALGGTPYTCYFYTQFWGDYLFHSIPYYQGTWVEQDSRLGQKLSHGCVRLATDNAKWIYDNVPSGTYVYVYN